MFNKDYYINSTISNYTDYREKKFIGLANDLYPYVKNKSVLDYGAATGAFMNELINMGVFCMGTDISYWAVDFGVKQYKLGKRLLHYNISLLEEDFDVVLFLDVLEHIPFEELNYVLDLLHASQVIVRIPVSAKEGEDFVLDVSKNDKTHIQIHSKQWWLDFFSVYGYSIFTPLDKVSIYDSEGVLAGILQRT